jgi:hypothetical protein
MRGDSMKRFYHNQNFRIIPRVIIDYAIAAYRVKYPHEIYTQNTEFLSGYSVVKGMNKKRPVQTGYGSITRASPTNAMVMV